MDRFMTHFRSRATSVLQRFGVAWHYQSVAGTLIAQNDQRHLDTTYPLAEGYSARGGRCARVAARIYGLRF